MKAAVPNCIALHMGGAETAVSLVEPILGDQQLAMKPPAANMIDAFPVPFTICMPLVELNATSMCGHGMTSWLPVDSLVSTLRSVDNHDVHVVRLPIDSSFSTADCCREPNGYVFDCVR